MKSNWLDVLENRISTLHINNVIDKIDSYYPRKTYFFNDTYLFIEFHDSKTIKTLEIGRFKNEVYSNYKFTLNTRKKDCIEVKQNLPEIELKNKHELTFNRKNIEVLSNFINRILLNGWIEEIYYFDNSEHIIQIKLLEKRYNISLKSNTEQDFPMLFDKTRRLLEDFYLKHISCSKRRKTTKIKIYPITF